MFNLQVMLLTVLGVLPLVSGASTVDLGLISSNNYFTHSVSQGQFDDTWTFELPANTGVNFRAENLYQWIGNYGDKIYPFSGSLDGASLVHSAGLFGGVVFQELKGSVVSSASGVHKVLLSGISLGGAGAYTLYFNLVPAPVPVPATVWLMGSALLGLFSLGRRQLK